MAWKQLRATRVSTNALLPSLSVASLFFTLDRLRLNVHNGATWKELAYRSDRPIGDLFFNEFKLASSETFPAVSREIDQDLSATNWPLAIPLLRAEVLTINGVSSFPCTVSGSTVTLTNGTTPGTAAYNLVKLFIADATVSYWLNNSQPATQTTDFSTVSTQRCVNISGIDYAVTGGSLAAGTLTVNGTPATGSQTLIVYPYRIAGSTTTARLLRISGFASVVAGDADGEACAGFRKMDRIGPHSHTQAMRYGAGTGTSLSAGGTDGGGNVGGNMALTMVADGINTLRSGKTTDPRTAGLHAYTWLGQFVAA